jgi:ribosomal subunit interface protein
MNITWNIVANNARVEPETKEQFRERIKQLEQHLGRCPPEAVHLQIVIERNQRTQVFELELNLRLPGNIVRIDNKGPDLIPAFEEAVEALSRELEARRCKHSEDAAQPESNQAGNEVPARVEFETESQPDGHGPHRLSDLVRMVLDQHYEELLQHARRHIRHDELAGDLPRGAVEAPEIVDEVARQAEARVRRKPKQLDLLPWFYHLMHEELRRQRQLYKERAAEEISTEQRVTLPEDKPKALQPIERMVNEVLEPEITRVEDVVPDLEVAPPDHIVEARELLDGLQDALRRWPLPEREVFELYFVRGFEPKQISAITGEPLRNIRERIASVQQRLRNELREEGMRPEKFREANQLLP